MPTRVKVSNIPLHVRKEEFANIFGALDGCLECRLVNENDRPVGYASFADERFASMARDAYHMWPGFGNSGLIVEILGELRPPIGSLDAADNGFRPGMMKRPPPEMLDPGGFKQRRGTGGLGEHGLPPLGSSFPAQQGPPSQERYRLPSQQEPGSASRFFEGGQYEDYVPAQSQLPPPGGFDNRGGYGNAKYGQGPHAAPAPVDQFGGMRVPPELQSQLMMLQGRQGQYGGEMDRMSDRHLDRPALDRTPPMGRPPERPPVRMEPMLRQYDNVRPGDARPGDERSGDGRLGDTYHKSPYDDRAPRRPHQDSFEGRGSQFEQHPGGPGPSQFQTPDGPPPRGERPFQGGPHGSGGMSPPYHKMGGHPERQPFNTDRGPNMPPPSSFDRSFPAYGAAGRAAAEAVAGTPLPPEARQVLYVEGLPADISQREVSHIFRPCPGFQKVRMVSKPSKMDPNVISMLAFVDFTDIASSTNAMHALQGYPLDPEASQTIVLKLKYAIDRHNRPSTYSGTRAVASRGGNHELSTRGSRGGQGRERGRGRGGTKSNSESNQPRSSTRAKSGSNR